MRSITRSIITLAAALALGACSENTSQSSSEHHGGGSRRWFGRESTVRGQHGEKLTLVRPASQTVRRGDAETLRIDLRRNGFNEPVTVSLGRLPSGVEAVDTPKSTQADSVEIVLRAGPNADLVGNQEVQVTAAGPNGMSATETFKLTVRDR